MVIEQIIYQHAVATPDKVAIISGDEAISYAVLWRNIRKAVAYFRQQRLPQGSRVLLSAGKEPNFLYCYFGAHLAGLICVPIDVETNPIRLARIVECARPAMMVGTLRHKGSYQVVPFGEAISDATAEVEFPSDHTIADLLFTTGTTGLPKGVGLSFKNHWAAATQINAFIKNTAEDVELIALPISHSFGLGRIRCVMQQGGTIVLIPGFVSMKRFFGEMERHHCTGFGMVPASWAYISKMSGDKIADFASQLHYIEIGSAFMPLDAKKRLMKLLPHTRICMHYGLTEASRSAFLSFHDDASKLNTAGKASLGVDIKLFDDEGNPVANGNEGEVCVKGSHVCACYWEQSDADFKRDFRGDYFRTGDCGVMDDEGFITLKSRIKELINVGGKKVSPVEVEEVLNTLDGITESACIGVPDPVMGEVVKAFVVGTLTPSDDDIIKKQLLGRVENYKVPVYIEHVASLPKTQNGKLQRLLLKNRQSDERTE